MKGDRRPDLSRSGGNADRLSGSVPAHDYLEVLCGPEDGKLFEIRGPVVSIGRLAENDICIPLELSISRYHARLSKTGDSYELEVLTGARNAATVGERLVAPGEKVILERGDLFKLGDVLFELGAGTECGNRRPNTNE